MFWDLRCPDNPTGIPTSRVRFATRGRGSASHLVALGLESDDIGFVDMRALGRGLVKKFTSFHTDDILYMQFHPEKHFNLVTCAADGLACVFDTRLNSEDDCLLSVCNVAVSYTHLTLPTILLV